MRKVGVEFELCYNHFLECYVDSRLHDAVRQRRRSGRGYRAVEATDEIRDHWENISGISSKTHLLCSNWCEPFYKSMARAFPPSSDTLYSAKWLSILCFDTFTAYDNGSVALLKRDFQNPTNYFELMKRIRQDILSHLGNSGATLQDFRRYDNPSEFFDEIPENSPRPIGNIIDKLYLTL